MRLREFALKEYDYMSLFTGGKQDPGQDKAWKSDLTYKYYIQDFVTKAQNTLNAAIQSGQIDPNIDSTKPERVKSTLQSKAAARDTQSKSIANFNNYVKQQSSSMTAEKDPAKKFELGKELVNRLADYSGQSEWQNASAAAKVAIKKAGYSPADMQRLILGLKDKQYVKESILTEQESISSFIVKWFNSAVRNLQYNEQPVKDAAVQIEKDIRNNKGKLGKTSLDQLNKLANAAYTAYMTNKQRPKQRPEREPRPASTQPAAAPSTPAQQPAPAKSSIIDPSTGKPFA